MIGKIKTIAKYFNFNKHFYFYCGMIFLKNPELTSGWRRKFGKIQLENKTISNSF